MNYRHAFHVGNHADVFKHMVLLFCLDALKRKPAPFAVLDTHAGRGLYDLLSDEALRSPEWQGGIGKLWDWPHAPPLAARLLDALRGFNSDHALRRYPGSPALIAGSLRPGDELMACELHPEEHAALARMGGAGVRVHARDGWEALEALLPPPQRRGLVLLDPPYEAENELARAAGALAGAQKRFGHGVYLWWRPLKDEAGLAAADAELRARWPASKETLRADLWVDAPSPVGKLVGSSLLLINPPYGLEPTLREALPHLAQRVSAGSAGWRIATGA